MTIRLVGFDADDTLWRSEDYFDAAQAEFERIVGGYVDLGDSRAVDRLYAVEKGNIALFGYGVKGMALSMIEAAIDIELRATTERLRCVAAPAELAATVTAIAIAARAG